MRIASSSASSDFAFQVTHSASSSQTTQTRLRAWVGRDPSVLAASAPRAVATTALAPTPSTALPSTATNSVQSSMDAIEHDPKMVMIRAFVEMMTGQSVRFVSAADLGIDNAPSTPSISPGATAAADATSPTTSATTSPTTPPITTTPAGFGIEFDSRTVVQETEQTDFQADAIVHTADGQTINLSLSLHMSRSYRSETNVSLRQGDAVKKDPLVINFGGKAAQLQSQRFKFDLNGDGIKDNVPLFSNDSDSGYLAIDLNHNGRIDSGRELFGPGTGNSFAELSRYDQDGNGWIDEGDAVFKQLKVWTPAATGNGTMTSLQARGVGALHLGHSATPFELRDGNNRSLGSVRSTGAYLMENGGAGTLQQIDLTV